MASWIYTTYKDGALGSIWLIISLPLRCWEEGGAGRDIRQSTDQQFYTPAPWEDIRQSTDQQSYTPAPWEGGSAAIKFESDNQQQCSVLAIVLVGNWGVALLFA